MDVSALPALNASLNATSAALLTMGWFAIRRGKRSLHRGLMIGAFFFISDASRGNRVESDTCAQAAIEKCPTAPQVSGWSMFQARTGSTSSCAQTRDRNVASA